MITNFSKILDIFLDELIPNTKTSINNVQSGLRPLSPDGLPFIGRHSKIKNMVLATGHSMMGWSLGPATGQLVTEVISGRKTSMDLKPFLPERI